MKVVPPKSDGSVKKNPLFPLVLEPEKELTASNSVSHLLRVKPSDDDSPTFKKHVRILTGDETVLEPGMVLAVDGSVATDTFRAQVGDSFIVTDGGYEQITQHSKSLEDIVL